MGTSDLNWPAIEERAGAPLDGMIAPVGISEDARSYWRGVFDAMRRPDVPIVIDPTMPPGYLEMRSGSQRVGTWIDGAANHDPGDEDRSER